MKKNYISPLTENTTLFGDATMQLAFITTSNNTFDEATEIE